MGSSKMNISSLLSPQPSESPQRQLSSRSPAQVDVPQHQYSNVKRSLEQARDIALNSAQGSPSFPMAHLEAIHRLPFDGGISNQYAVMGSSNGAAETSGRSMVGSMRSPLPESRSSHGVTPQPSLLHRPSHIEKMEFLADIASMQHHQQQQQNLRYDIQGHWHHSEMQDIRHSPSVSRRPSLIPTAGDHPLSDAPTAIIESRAVMATSLSQEDLQAIAKLIQQLKENSYLYESHVRLINLLHQGFVSHICPSDAPDTLGDPLEYPLLRDMRQAREAMDSRFPVGEDLWLDWLQDECILASSIEDRLAVMELCQKAVQDEAGSSKLWRLYGDWMWYIYKSSTSSTVVYEHNSLEHHNLVGMVLANQAWSQEDKLVGQEVFGWDTMLNVWIQGAQATSWHINDSHLVWHPYLEIVTNDLYRNPTSEKITMVRRLLNQRLLQPHTSWEETFQLFSNYITKYDNDSYEDIMINTARQTSAAKQDFALRQDLESKLSRAAESGDKNVEWAAFTEYFEWETTQSKKRNSSKSSFELRTALYERANLRFPNDTEFWEDHMDFAQDSARYAYALLAIAERATRHCPWSGNLWSRRLSALEAAEKDFSELEEVKHHATSTGLLEEIGGIEEIIKVHTSWCGFLRRRAFAHGSGEEELDVAEVGILSAVEDIRAIGEKKYGKEFKGDPLFRPEKILLNFLMQAHRLTEARRFWDNLALTHGDSYDFWDRYYLWEMVCWGRQLNLDTSNGHAPHIPEHATAVLQCAVKRSSLDWPEKMISAYLHHCAQFESITKVQEAQVEARRVTKEIVKRRAKEAADALNVFSSTTTETSNGHSSSLRETEVGIGGGKRKRDSEPFVEEAASQKRVREDCGATLEIELGDPSMSATSSLKRDRENTTVIVKNLPAETTENRVKQFFRDCGKIQSINIIPDSQNESSTATIEFESKEDVLSAQTKGMKSFDGHSIEIQVGTGTTLWVTNYPPEADEEYIRNLFKPFGDVIEVRFPSLKLNTHRRFCYVQFLTSQQAEAAIQLNGKAMGGKLVLNAKISDPSAKKGRQGAMHEGRELHVGNVDWSASEHDVKALFSPYGTIESVRIPRNMSGKSKGTAFIVFGSQSEATLALEMNLKEFKSRILNVSFSVPNAKGAKRVATTIISNISDTGSPPVDLHMNGQSPESDAAAMRSSNQTESRANNHYARTLALLDIPDTVNDARIRSVMEKYGPLRKIVLRPDHAGAIVEFENAADVGRAELGIAGFEILPGQKLRVGSVAEMLRERYKAIEPNLRAAQIIRRPGQTTSKRGGRGGLGFKRADVAPNGAVALPKEGKSNADFRALINKN